MPFVALADLEPEPIESLTVDWQSSAEWTFDNGAIYSVSPLADNAESQEASMKFWHDKDAIIRKVESIPWDLEAPREKVERLNEILAEVDSRLVPWFIAE